MNAISVRRLEPEVHNWLREQAAAHGVSMEEEVRRLLRTAREADTARRNAERRAQWEAVFSQAVTLPPGSPNSTDVIRQMRDER